MSQGCYQLVNNWLLTFIDVQITALFVFELQITDTMVYTN